MNETHSVARPRIAFIGADITNPTLILRVRSFIRLGCDVTSFSFRRTKFNVEYQPEWPNIHLGETIDRHYLRRLPTLFYAISVLVKHRRVFRDAEVIYCRHIDLLGIGIAAKWLTRSHAKLVYEIEDVQEVFFKKTMKGAIFRWLEGRALKFIDLLVVLSPGFLRGYFEPVFDYSGPSFVLENKIQLGGRSAESTPAGSMWQGITDRWVIGWFGTLRCPKSMALLEEIAERLGDRVEIYTRGYPTESGLDAYMEIVNRHPNWTYEGEYTIPEDLEDMYGRVHFSWCIDFLDEFGNSPLLLACRMYQGGFYGSVPLALEGTEMDRWLTSAGVGHIVGAPHVDTIVDLIENFDAETYKQERAEMMARRHELFEEDGRETKALLEKMLTV